MRIIHGYLQRRPALQAIVFLLLGAATLQVQAEKTYVGSEACFECHSAKYNDWKVSGHPYKLITSEAARNRPIPLPEGYSWDDISYVIGGYKWKSRYMDNEGYIITSHINTDGIDIPGLTQYNNMTGEWVDYHAGEEDLPYNCGSCHTTAWVENLDPTNLDGNQDGLPGIHGTFEFGGIHCEECHGPGSRHVDFTGSDMIVDKSSLSCGGCHIRGESDTIPASGGFIKHHEQYNELLASPHNDENGAGCVDCHDSHKKSEFSVLQTCKDCHQEVAESYATTTKSQVGVTCVDCHMSMASKSAVALGPYKGDVKTHLFRINTDAEAQMFTDDGSFVALDDNGQGAVTLDFACISCHQDKDIDWAAEYAQNFHSVFDVSLDSFTAPGNIQSGDTKRLKTVITNAGPDTAKGNLTILGYEGGVVKPDVDHTLEQNYGPLAMGDSIEVVIDWTAPVVESRLLILWVATIESNGDTTPDNNTREDATYVNKLKE